MFDRHLHVTERGHQTVTVNHQHAPTDESVKLLREMERAARDKVVQSIRLENSPIDCVIHTQENLMNSQSDFLIFIRINGKQLEVRKLFDFDADFEKIAEGLLQATSARIAAELLGPAFGRLPNKFKGR